jgi:hypothetical protein
VTGPCLVPYHDMYSFVHGRTGIASGRKPGLAAQRMAAGTRTGLNLVQYYSTKFSARSRSYYMYLLVDLQGRGTSKGEFRV